MSRPRTVMRKIREVLRLTFGERQSRRRVGQAYAVQQFEAALCCLADVLVNDATQAIAAQHRSHVRGPKRLRVPRDDLPQPLVRPRLLVVLDELPQHVLQMLTAEDQKMIEHLAPNRPDPPFGV